MYNLVKRQAEVEILPMARAEGLGVIPYSPLGGGLLTGKYGRAERAELPAALSRTRCTRLDTASTGCGRRPSVRGVRRGARLRPGESGRGLGREPPGDHGADHRRPERGAARSSVASLDIDMTPELRDEVSALSPEPPPATDRTEERTPFNYGVR